MSTTRRLRHIFCFAIAGGIALVGAVPARAQLPQARLFSIFPCGGKAGSTVELSLTTVADLDEADHLLFNHPGITAVPKTTDAGGNKKPVPNVFEVTIRPDVPSGIYEVYAGGLFGLSNPRVFVVGSQDESRESEPNNDPEKANALTLGHIVNGTLGAATDVDYFPLPRSARPAHRRHLPCLGSRFADVTCDRDFHIGHGRRLGYARGTTARSGGRRRTARRWGVPCQGARFSVPWWTRIYLPPRGRHVPLHRLRDAACRCGGIDRSLHSLWPESSRRETGRNERGRAAPR